MQTQIQPHVDHRNAPETENYVLSVPGQTCLWTLERLSPQSTPAGDLGPEEGKGYITPIGRCLQPFRPKVRHSLVKTPDFVIAAFTPLGVQFNFSFTRSAQLEYALRRPSDCTFGRRQLSAARAPRAVARSRCHARPTRMYSDVRKHSLPKQRNLGATTT